ncbi:MAG TPA: GNAT family N-acetyltransferase [Cellulomonas sp.]
MTGAPASADLASPVDPARPPAAARPAGITVRAAVPADHDAIARTLLSAFTATFTITDWYRDNLSRVAEHAVDHEWWVAVDADGAVLGALMTPRDLDPGTELGFRLLGVHPQARGRGAAVALVEHVIGLARERGHHRLGIWSGPQMGAAHRLYERLGFARVPERETRVVDGGQRLLAFVLDLDPDPADPAPSRPSTVASPVDFVTYGTIYAPRDVPEASTARGADAYPFRGRVTAGEGPYPAEPGRYHLYVSWACPFAHRVALVRALKGLQDVLPLWVVDPIRDGRGWAFRDGTDLTRDGGGQRFTLLREAYDRTVGGSYTGRISVPVLWDSHEGRIVSNHYPHLTLDLGHAFDAWAGEPDLDLYPAGLRAEIDALDAHVHRTLSTGVYAAGFATSQQEYDQAAEQVFATLELLEQRLADRRYLVGDTLTEADVRLWPTLARFDLVYHGHFKLNRRRLADHPRLSAYTADLYRLPAFRETTYPDQIRRHYYGTQRHVNPTGIVPVGPTPDWLA